VIATSGVAADAIAGIGLSGQMHGAVLLGADEAVLRPSIIWCDQRSEAECRWLNDTIGPQRLLDLTSNPALTNFTLTKLLWVRRHEPDLWRQVRHVLLPKDYIRFRLSGEHAIDVADASGTLMLDVARRCWSQPMLDAAEIDSRLLPAVFESPAICARVSTHAAGLTGLSAGTPIVAGAGDQAAGAIGMGITRPGAVSATIGTSGVVFAATDRPATDPKGRIHTFCHAIPGRWHVMGVTQAAGLSLRWFRDQLAAGASYDQLTAEAERVLTATPTPAPHSSGWQRATAAVISSARSWSAWRSACATRSRSFPNWIYQSAASGSEAADRVPGSGGRSRPTSTGSRSTPPQTRERHTARPFWPPSALASGQRWMRRAMLWSAAPGRRCPSRRLSH